MLHIHENTIKRKGDEGLKKQCMINITGQRQFRKAEVAALLSMLNAYNARKRILV